MLSGGAWVVGTDQMASDCELNREDKRQLRDNGFIIIRNAVPMDVVMRARALIAAALPENERRLLVPGKLATHPSVVGLFYDGRVSRILRELMGPFPPVISCQVAVTPGHDDLGGAPGTHVDGGWSGVIPGTEEEIDPVTH